MPACGITTNIPRHGLDVPKICSDLAELLSKLLKFPVESIIVQLQFKTHFCFFGHTSGPVAMVELYNVYAPSIDQPRLNAEVSKQVSAFLEERLKVPRNRYLMGFLPIEYYQVGMDGSIAAWLPPVGSPPEDVQQEECQE